MRPNVDRLLRGVGVRQELASVARRFYALVLCIAAAHAVLLLCSRLLAVIPDVFTPLTLVAVPGLALAASLLFHRRARPAQTARLVDTRMQTDDLFLTNALLDSSAGQYQPLVRGAAEDRAASIRPAAVVSFRCGRKARNVGLALAALLAGVLFLPQLDPFGREQERDRAQERKEQLDNSRRATALRAETLRKGKTDAALSEEVDMALERLKQSFNTMKRTDMQGNLQKLSMRQQEIGKMWREAGMAKLRDAFSQQQQFGASDSKAGQWRRQLRQGSSQGMQNELAEIKQAVEKLKDMPDSAEKARLREQIKKRLQALSKFASSEACSQGARSAMDSALEQLAMSQMDGLSGEALDALLESLDLADMEMAALAQAARDLQALEDALKTLQMAKSANQQNPLDGRESASCNSMSDYEEMYRKMMAAGQGTCEVHAPGECDGGASGTCSGTSPGIGGRGRGRGGLASEDNDAESDFQSEVSRSTLTAGKILLSLKARGVSRAGEAREEYVKHLKEVEQGVSEAILHEQIPPAYHEAIQTYFDNVEGADAHATEE